MGRVNGGRWGGSKTLPTTGPVGTVGTWLVVNLGLGRL